MNRLIVLTLTMTFSLLHCFAQDTPVKRQPANQFLRNYNNDQADSLYTLFSEEVKKSVQRPNVPVIISQLKGQFGKLVNTEFFKSGKGFSTYIGVFEKSGPVLYLNFDDSDHLAGFFVNADQRQKTTLKEGEQEVNVKTATSMLKGTLSVPSMSGKMPVLILIAGSGPTDRNGNSTMINGKPDYLLKISDELRSNNIAVLRYDKRGIGQSTSIKTEAESTFDDMVTDAAAVIQFLKNDVRFSKVIVAGHSEGSLVGMLASQRENVDGFISLAGAGFPADVAMKWQFKEVLPPDDYHMALSALDTIKAGIPLKQTLKNGFESFFRLSVQPYLRSWMRYDPQAEISKLKVPVLIVQGANDIQVSVDDAMQLSKAQPKAKLVIIDGMSHILKEAPADRKLNAATYSNNELGLHPKIISTLTSYIHSL